jgi:hypothetical protein
MTAKLVAEGKKIKLMPFETWEKETFGDGPALDEDVAQGRKNAKGNISVNDFYAVMPTHSYIYTPNREMWPASSINARIDPVVICDDDGDPVLNKNGDSRRSRRAKGWTC